MDWKEIKEKYPKGFEKLEDWVKAHFFELEHTDRNLYDFFDENEIFVEVEICYNIDHNHDWAYGIFNNRVDKLTECFKSYKTRKEAEEAAFNKAFEILEEKLNKK